MNAPGEGLELAKPEGSMQNSNSKKPTSHSEEAVDAAIVLLRRRLTSCTWGDDGGAQGMKLLPEAEENRRKVEEMLEQTVVAAFNNSALLLGPRGCGKSMVVEICLSNLQRKHTGLICPVRLHGLLHADDRAALKEIARQLCSEHNLAFAKTSSFDDNLLFLNDMLRECANCHRAVIFVLDEFDLFAQKPRQSLLYNLLEALQSSRVQAAVLALTSRLDADQLLEKRVRSRFSHRKLVFLPPSAADAAELIRNVLTLPGPPSFPFPEYAAFFNEEASKLLESARWRQLVSEYADVDSSPRHILDLLFRAVCLMDRRRGYLTLGNFEEARMALWQPVKAAMLADVAVLELYLLVAMKRLEDKELEPYNFHTVFDEYSSIQTYATATSADIYSRPVALRAFEQLLEKELAAFTEGKRGHGDLFEYRTVKLLVSPREIKQTLELHSGCPQHLKVWFSRETVTRGGRQC